MTSPIPPGEARDLAAQLLGDLMKDWDPEDAREALAGIESIDVYVPRTEGVPEDTCTMCGGAKQVVEGHDCPRCDGTGQEG